MLSFSWKLCTAAMCMLSITSIEGRHSSQSLLSKRFAVEDCYRNFNTDPRCSVVNVAFYSDDACAQPMALDRHAASRAGADDFVRGNAKMLFDSAISATPSNFRSIKILAATEGFGVGFAQHPDSDTLIMNMAWLSAADVSQAFKRQSCLQLTNVYAPLARQWTVKNEATLNQPGYIWNAHNLPLKTNVAACSSHVTRKARGVCLEPRSWGAGGVLEMYKSLDCTGIPIHQTFNSAQCEPLSLTEFSSFKPVQPLGQTVNFTFSDEYYALGREGYHACGHKNVVTRPFLPGKCQKLVSRGAFVGVYGNDPLYPQAGPDPGAVPIKKGK